MNPVAHKSAVLLAASALLAPATLAQTSVTLAQFEQQIQVLAQKKKGPTPEQLSHFQLTQRVSNARLAHWQSQCKGQLAWQTLIYLADVSSINELPDEDRPSAPPPDEAASVAILERAREYVRNMRPRLPNFSATRATTTFQIATLEQMKGQERQLQMMQFSGSRLGFRSLGAVAQIRQLFLEGSDESLVTYRGGIELQTPSKAHGKRRPLAPLSMTSAGEFGSILTLVDHDTVDGSIDWNHWEQGPAGLLAVYAFRVPAGRSHFKVSSPIVNMPGIPSEDYPAYHGEVAVDPDTGSVFRLAIIADPSASSPDLRITTPAAIVVEYGSVEIGGKNYICPIHSIAINQVIDSDQQPPRTLVNDVTYSGYHLFRSEMRMVP